MSEKEEEIVPDTPDTVDIRVMTAITPIMMPSRVRKERTLLLRMLSSAIAMLSRNIISFLRRVLSIAHTSSI